MRFHILLFVLLLITASSFSQTIPDNWKLSPKQAARMIQYFNDCEGECFSSKATPDSTKEDLIRSVFTDAKSFTWVNARYTLEDVSRYASRNAKVIKTEEAVMVSGYTTKILKVVDENGAVHYFDISVICPPPSMCD